VKPRSRIIFGTGMSKRKKQRKKRGSKALCYLSFDRKVLSGTITAPEHVKLRDDKQAQADICRGEIKKKRGEKKGTKAAVIVDKNTRIEHRDTVSLRKKHGLP